jgi:hypothetical protein
MLPSEAVRVRIVARDGGRYYSSNVLLNWRCPVCGKRRGADIQWQVFREGDVVLLAYIWKNECGHVEVWEALENEARTNGLNQVDGESGKLTGKDLPCFEMWEMYEKEAGVYERR